MTDIFISYASSEEKIANQICNTLEEQGVSCWIAPRNIQVGKEYGAEIIEGIENCKVFFLCLSKASNESQHVLREVERAVNKRLPIIVYQYEETTLSKSLEYFLASTQWFIPKGDEDFAGLIDAIDKLKNKKVAKKKNSNKKPYRKWIYGVGILAAVVLFLGIKFFSKSQKTEVLAGTVFTYGSLDLTGSSKENLNWMVLEVDDKEETAICICENIVAFFPYDGAESGIRGKSGELYYTEENLDNYTEEQLRQFWGSADWETSNIRSWLNSDEAIVTYEGMKPSEDTTSLYENHYDTIPGFLYSFTEEEKSQLVKVSLESNSKAGERITTEDKVFLLSEEEVNQYFIEQNLVISAIPTESAILLEGTGIYEEYYEVGNRSTYWGLRTQGENACSIICAGGGLGESELFHSEYACSSLMGVRPVIILPLEYIETLNSNEEK